jgi:hypothetical protein
MTTSRNHVSAPYYGVDRKQSKAYAVASTKPPLVLEAVSVETFFSFVHMDSISAKFLPIIHVHIYRWIFSVRMTEVDDSGEFIRKRAPMFRLTNH